MDALWIAAAIGLFGVQSAALRRVSAHSLRENLLTTGVSCGLIALALGVYALLAGQALPGPTMLLGAAVGVDFLATIAVYDLALQAGPLCYTSFFFSASMLIPAAAGVALWGEPLTPAVLIGVGLFLAAFFCISVLGGPKGGRVNRAWLGLCAMTFLLNGSLSVLITLHERVLGGGGSLLRSAQLLLAAFLTAFVVAGAVFLLGGGRAQRREELGRIRRGLGPLALAALGTGGGNVLVSFLSGRVPSSYLFPIVQGGTLVVITLYAHLALRERLSPAGRVGIALGLAAIVALNL